MTQFRPGGFQMIPPVIKNLVIINGLIFLAQQTLGASVENYITDMFGLHTVQSPLFKPHQLITYMFLHGNFQHILYNMFALWMFGSILENYWGAKRFLTFYVVSGIGAAVVHMIVLYMEMAPVADALKNSALYSADDVEKLTLILNNATIGASGAVFGCLAAFGFLFPNSEIYLYFLIPIKAKWLVLAYAALELFAGIRATAGDQVAHWAHLGGGLVGLLLVIYWNRTNRRNFY
jgi:membrane associated rhomboid family serine protease